MKIIVFTTIVVALAFQQYLLIRTFDLNDMLQRSIMHNLEITDAVCIKKVNQ